MKYRKLRIAWSVGCAIVCLLLIALWVRSYWWFDFCFADSHSVMSYSGHLYVDAGISCTLGSCTAEFERDLEAAYIGSYRIPSSGAGPSTERVTIPIWMLPLFAAIIAALPWYGSRFSLRTLLIATTLVAAILGLIVYANRN